MIHRLLKVDSGHGGGEKKCSCGQFREHFGYCNSKTSKEIARLFLAHVRESQAKEAEALEVKRRNALQSRLARERELKRRRGKRPAKKHWRKLDHRSWIWKRTLYMDGTLERAFADLWEKECQPRGSINFGHGSLQDLFIDTDGAGWMHSRKIIAEMSNRDAMIAATAAMQGVMWDRKKLIVKCNDDPAYVDFVITELIDAGVLEMLSRPAGEFVSMTALGRRITGLVIGFSMREKIITWLPEESLAGLKLFHKRITSA